MTNFLKQAISSDEFRKSGFIPRDEQKSMFCIQVILIILDNQEITNSSVLKPTGLLPRNIVDWQTSSSNPY
jgi:hypothetical protein